MRNFISILFILTLSLSCSPVTTIYLVRHAEKIDNSKDPDLSAIGIARADRLSRADRGGDHGQAR